MATNVICAPTQFPTFNDFFNQLSGLKLKFDPNIHLPTMPSPLFANINMPSLHKVNLAAELVLNQFLNWIMAVIQPMMNFVGAIPFPVIPILGLTLPDLLAGFDMAALVARFRNALSGLTVPSLPDPLMPSINAPDFEVVTKIQALIRDYCVALITMVTSLIDMVISKLGKKPFNFGVSFPALPNIPTSFAGLMALFAIPDFGSLHGLNIADFFSNLSLPGFPGLNFAIPSPFFGDVSVPEIEFVEIMKNMFMAMVMWCAAKIGDFCALVSRFISFSLPTVCVPVPVAD